MSTQTRAEATALPTLSFIRRSRIKPVDNQSSSKPLKILIVAAEVVPFAKVGGLADVAGALPIALRDMGHDVRVAMPKYGRIDNAKFNLKPIIEPFAVPMDGHSVDVDILEGSIAEHVPVYFIHNEHYFDREGIYSYPDDDERFILFCRAAVEMLKKLNWQPDIIHCNDWQTAIIPNWLKTIYKDDPFFAHTASLYTIHNLAYQGVFGQRVLEIAGIAEHGFVYPQIQDLAGVVDLMGRGILYADAINTVSETYAQEILTPEFGEKLDPLLRERQDRLFGILNGIDTELMNPKTDSYIAANFDAMNLEARAANKADLQKEGNLDPRPDVPVIGLISRLANQKGFDIMAPVMDSLLNLLDVQFVLLGTGDQYYHEMFGKLAAHYPGKAAVFLTFNASLAQKIYAGSDIFLMPSRFEPCGLGQMIAMRYGSIPAVRSTGGLADTVHDFSPTTGEGNGFAFTPYEPMALYATLVRALENYRYKDTWRKLQTRDMSADYSWDNSARKYVDVYRKAMSFQAQQ